MLHTDRKVSGGERRDTIDLAAEIQEQSAYNERRGNLEKTKIKNFYELLYVTSHVEKELRTIKRINCFCSGSSSGAVVSAGSEQMFRHA